jgi:two-component system cell cycle sensor histidine kinase/response regulator CckA
MATTFFILLPWNIGVLALLFAAWIYQKYQREVRGRKVADAELQRRSVALQRMQRAIESASDAIGIGDFEGHSLYHNPAHIALFGYTVEQLNSVPEGGVLFADPSVAGEIHRSLREGRSWSGEVDVRAQDGRRVPALVRADIIRDEAGQPVGIFGVFTDITERRKIVAALAAERQRLAITLESIVDGVVTTDRDGCVELMNPVAEQLTGWTHAEARGKPLDVVMPLLDERSRTPRSVIVSQRATGSQNPLGDLANILQMRDGRERLVGSMAGALDDRDGKQQGLVIVFRDITLERRRADEREYANKLESLGLLAGGIAHDFANLLTAIIGHLALAQTTEGLPEEAAGRLAHVERAAMRARDLTQQLLTFAKDGAPRKERVSLDSIMREAVMFALTEAPDVVVDFSIPDNLWPLEADVGQLGQVFNNLALNAVQAMDARGRLRITVDNAEPGAVRGHALADRRVVHVRITDTGTGIAPESVAKIFDPFFTTKAKGTGLGLATVYSIVQKHGGHIEVESVVGVGTTFHVYLPVAETALAETRTTITAQG